MLESPVGISVPLAICLGLLASFIQSLGLTIQRKAHIQNESNPITKRKSVWRMPLFLIGFIIFISANIGGTIFQIGALPLTILAPLGAVSLLFNALLARVLLNGLLSFYMVSGTVLISLGAVLIGYFGAVQETQHSLDELLSLYSRPAFVAFATIAFLVFVGVLAIAHLAEWQLQASLWRSSNPILNSPSLKKKKKKSQPLRRRWSAPSLAPVVEVNESTSGIATPILDLVDEANRRGVPADKLIEAAKQREKENQLKETKKKGVTNQDVSKSTTLPRRKDYGTLSSIKTSNSNSSSNNSTPSSPTTPRIANRTANGSTSIPGPLRRNSEPPTLNAQDSASCSLEESVIRRTQLGLAVAYGAASGTLSGVCLLLAKSGVELLVLTFSGQNQFGRWQSWALVLIMLMAALLQLWYLNKSLKLADPTLVCPLAFCFYNTSSIALGLVYFNQLDSLAWYSVVLVVLGTAILLSGVWIVSLHGSSSSEDDESIEEETTTMSIIQSPISTTSSINGSSGIETSDATETSALLANAAGIVGPHLPPPTSPEQPLESGATSPTTPLSPRKKRNRSHSRTGSIRLFSGSGIEPDSSPFYNKDEDEEDLEISANDPNQPQYATINSNPKESRMKLYTSLLERGLSIGISPSSPGFLLSGSNEGPSSPGGTQRSYSSSRKLSRRERQTFSESDVETLENPSIENVLGLSRNEEEESQSQLTTSNSNETIRESQNQTQGVNQDRLETGYSRFNRIPGVDVGALTERLGRLGGGGTRTNGGEERGGLLSWIPTFGFGRNANGSANGVVGDGSIEERRSLLEQEEGNARPREPPWAGTRRR